MNFIKKFRFKAHWMNFNEIAQYKSANESASEGLPMKVTLLM